MGTVFNQPERSYYHVSEDLIEAEIDMIKRVSNEMDIDFNTVLRVNELLETRRKNTLFIYDKDIVDEQIAGFAELIKEAITAYKPFCLAVKRKKPDSYS